MTHTFKKVVTWGREAGLELGKCKGVTQTYVVKLPKSTGVQKFGGCQAGLAPMLNQALGGIKKSGKINIYT